jgi:integrase
LFAHYGAGQWCKKIRKRLVYFGSYRTDPDGTKALERFNREWPYLCKGETPPAVDISNGLSLRVLCNQFLAAKEEMLRAGELSHRMFRDYYAVCAALIGHFGKDRRVDDLRPDDFRRFRAKLTERFGPNSLKSRIIRCRGVLNFAFDNQLIDKPVQYGSCFAPPSALTIRRHRNQGGPKLFEREEVLRILNEADVAMRAMILLGVNCGFGNSDVASLPQSAVNLKSGWLEFPRPKTEVHRRIPLWKETTTALEKALAVRHAAADPKDKDLWFLTQQGRPWVRIKVKRPKPGGAPVKDEPQAKDYIPIDALSQALAKILKRLEINGRRGLGFYSLRHCFETYAGESRDQVAVDAVMGHVDSSMAANYRHRVSDERLQAVVETVRVWLFGAEKGGES